MALSLAPYNSEVALFSNGCGGDLDELVTRSVKGRVVLSPTFHSTGFAPVASWTKSRARLGRRSSQSWHRILALCALAMPPLYWRRLSTR
jgi:hypothetical protein